MKEIKSSYPIGQLLDAWGAAQAMYGDTPSWLQKAREQGVAFLKQNGLPNRRHEEWKYTSLRTVADTRWQMAHQPIELSSDILEESFLPGAIRLVFVDGVFASQYSEFSGVQGLSFSHFADEKTLGTADAQMLLPTELNPETDSIVALNQAFMHQGLVVELAPNTKLERPVQVLFYANKYHHPYISAPRLALRVGAGSEMSFIELHVGDRQASYLHAPVVSVRVGQNAIASHLRINTDAESGVHLADTNVKVERDGVYKNFCGSFSGGLVRHNVAASLLAEGARAVLDGVYVAKGSEHVDYHTVIDHRVAHTNSEQLYKGILAGHGRAVFNGKIFVRRNAKLVNANQLNKNLLLSSAAEVDTKPQLEIDNDDVKCSHGATIGRLRQDELFYLQSRGVDHVAAQRILVRAFAVDAIERLKIPALQDFSMHWLDRHLPEAISDV